jgi:uncharacterized protein (TIGR03067 family)
MNRIRLVFLALIFTACAAVCADEPKKDAPKGKESVRLDTKTLGEMLVDMGLETKLVDDIFHKIRWSIKDSEFPLWLSISTDKRTLWVYTEFKLRSDCDKAPATAWLKLLEKNDAIGPSRFALDEKGKRLTFRRPLNNADLTAAQLRKELNSFVEDLKANQELWQPAAFLPPLTPEATKMLGKLAGNWKITESTSMGKPVPPEATAKVTFTIEKNQFRTFKDGNETPKSTIYLEVHDGKITIDLVGTSVTERGILKLEGETLTLCTAYGDAERPTDFTSTEKNKNTLLVLKRQKP